jgi:hypothetical protein
VDLDSSRIQIIKNFIAKARELNGECPIKSTSVDNYKIIIKNDTTYNIYGNCDWVGLDYHSIEKLIFIDHFVNLEKQRASLKDSVCNELKGQWIITGLHKDIKQKDIITMSRTNDIDHLKIGTVVWEFFDSFKFKSHDNKIIDLTFSKDYQLIVENGYVDLRIGSGAITDSNGNMTIENYGSDFIIKEIESGKIILEYLWR